MCECYFSIIMFLVLRRLRSFPCWSYAVCGLLFVRSLVSMVVFNTYMPENKLWTPKAYIVFSTVCGLQCSVPPNTVTINASGSAETHPNMQVPPHQNLDSKTRWSKIVHSISHSTGNEPIRTCADHDMSNARQMAETRQVFTTLICCGRGVWIHALHVAGRRLLPLGHNSGHVLGRSVGIAHNDIRYTIQPRPHSWNDWHSADFTVITLP